MPYFATDASRNLYPHIASVTCLVEHFWSSRFRHRQATAGIIIRRDLAPGLNKGDSGSRTSDWLKSFGVDDKTVVLINWIITLIVAQGFQPNSALLLGGQCHRACSKVLGGP